MMKKLTILFLLLTIALGALAQDRIFKKGDQVMSLGLGVGAGMLGVTRIPFSAFTYEVGIADEIIPILFDHVNLSIGLYGGFGGSIDDYTTPSYSYGYKYNYTVYGATTSIHFQLLDDLDTYATFMAGYMNVSRVHYEHLNGGENTLPLYHPSSFSYDFTAGVRYYLSDKFAIMGEFGFRLAYLTFGVAYKI